MQHRKRPRPAVDRGAAKGFTVPNQHSKPQPEAQGSVGRVPDHATICSVAGGFHFMAPAKFMREAYRREGMPDEEIERALMLLVWPEGRA